MSPDRAGRSGCRSFRPSAFRAYMVHKISVAAAKISLRLSFIGCYGPVSGDGDMRGDVFGERHCDNPYPIRHHIAVMFGPGFIMY